MGAACHGYAAVCGTELGHFDFRFSIKDTQYYSGANLFRVIKVQSAVRTFLARRRYRSERKNPAIFVIVLPADPRLWFCFQARNRQQLKEGGKHHREYYSAKVERVLSQLGEFVYND